MSKQVGWGDLRRVFPYLRGVRRLFVVSLFLLLFLSAMTAAKAWIVQPAVDTFLEEDATRGQLYALCAIVIGLFVAAAALNWFYLIVSQMAGSRIVKRIRADLFQHLMGQDLGYFANRPTSDLTSRVVNDVVAFNYTVIGGLQNFLRDLFTLLLLLAVMFSMDWRLALVCLVVLGVLGLVMRFAARRLSVVSRRVQEMLAKVANQLIEMIGGIEVILSFGMSRKWRERFDAVNHENYESYLKAQRTGATASAAISVIVGLGLGAILLLTGGALLEGSITPGRFMSLLAAMYLIQGPMLGIGNAVAGLAAGLAAGGRALELLDDKPHVTEPTAPTRLTNPEGRIEFAGVTFGYAELPAIRDVSFAVEPGQLVAMLGDSGAGKSTIARLLLRFYDPAAGQVLLDGIDVRELKREDLYRAASYVSQDVFLFDGTIELNLKVGKPDATGEDVAEAVSVAGLGDFLAELPDGLQTVVGERGVLLSGGQRQRISIARAVLTDAPILVLDEATSALDMDLERRVLTNLVQSRRRRTIFAISHRLSLAAVADRVLVLKGGRLAEEGTAASLSDRKGEFARLQRAAGAHPLQ